MLAYSFRISSYSAAREDKLRAGTMHIGFQRLLNEFTDDTDLKYCDFGVPALSPKTPADLHLHYVTHMFRCHFSTQQTLAPALHDGTVSWESLKTMFFAEFRALHSGLNIPVTKAHSCENVTEVKKRH